MRPQHTRPIEFQVKQVEFEANEPPNGPQSGSEQPALALPYRSTGHAVLGAVRGRDDPDWDEAAGSHKSEGGCWLKWFYSKPRKT